MIRSAHPPLRALMPALALALALVLLAATTALSGEAKQVALVAGAAGMPLKSGACGRTGEIEIQARGGRIAASGSASGPVRVQIKCGPGSAQSPKGRFDGDWAFSAPTTATSDITLHCRLVVCNLGRSVTIVSLATFGAGH